VEELDGVIEEHCLNIGVNVRGKEIFGCIGELSQNRIRKALGLALPKSVGFSEDVPARPPVMCAGCPHRGIYYVMKKLGLCVFGDIGCYTLGAVAPLQALDTTICMGASISGIHGFNKANSFYAAEHADGEVTTGKTVCVIGDSTFMHSGMTGLANVAYNESNSTVVILDNSITGMTGHQQNPTTGYNLKGDACTKIDLEALCHAMGIERVKVVDPYDLAACEKALKEELAYDGPSVIISRRPCALLKYVKHAGPIRVEEDKCVGCRSCMKVGCPAISMKDKKAVIDTTLCTGCRVCSQLCKTAAI